MGGALRGALARVPEMGWRTYLEVLSVCGLVSVTVVKLLMGVMDGWWPKLHGPIIAQYLCGLQLESVSFWRGNKV